ncbi:DUF4258 domain-containing protein [Hyunsoonleella sp. SJ7]|uniref:DUF4258 domain-containing protein n=1 Tax=Hyunsoonleella aquatilis TaxID=2762758 RepID=A0A923HBU1_9FLAO|nr:DUF4258 domain-containing protein [Hyunsoonleella aquatilis]MBC3758967.1 DUF4258 domain-containing protein [Hyunsoonleella aquatilis]
MRLIQRIGYYLGGFSIGLIVLAFFFSGKKTSCAYGPEARVLKNINSKPLKFQIENSTIEIDTPLVKELLKTGKVDFSKSDTRREPCGIYIVEGKINEENVELSVENCENNVKIIALSKSND